MFHIFQKKRFLVDTLKGFVDIHNHILPGIDDGAKTVKDSIAMIRGFESFGISHFIATPHIMTDYYPNTRESINDALDLLKIELLKAGIDNVSIQVAAEHMIDDKFENILEEGAVLPLRKDYILVEMSYLQASINLITALEETKRKGYFPILAHPERYLYYKNNPGMFSYLKNRGTMLQLNMLSLGKYYGHETHKIALHVLGENLVDFIASDVHHMKHLKELSRIQITEKTLNRLLPILERTIQHFY